MKTLKKAPTSMTFCKDEIVRDEITSLPSEFINYACASCPPEGQNDCEKQRGEKGRALRRRVATGVTRFIRADGGMDRETVGGFAPESNCLGGNRESPPLSSLPLPQDLRLPFSIARSSSSRRLNLKV